MSAREPPAILIVEDDRIVAKDLQQSLIELGYDAFAIAASADEAVACASARCPDVVLMDIRIKGPMDGIQTAAILKKQFPVIVIYLTAHADEPMLDRAKRTEPHGYLVKPVKMAEMRSMIEIVLNRRDIERELQKAHERSRALARRLDTVREEERRAVALVLHDGIAQDLFAMKLDLGRLEALVKGRAVVRKLCQEITQAVTRCIEATRQVANELRPVALAYCKLSSVITEYARRFAQSSSLEIKITEISEIPLLDEPTQLLLFRAAQEALTNVARHARATAVEIILGVDGGRISMQIVDDGIGMEEGAMNKPRSLGILGLRERFTSLGGGLNVSPARPTGTVLTVYLPESSDRAAHAA